MRSVVYYLLPLVLSYPDKYAHALQQASSFDKIWNTHLIVPGTLPYAAEFHPDQPYLSGADEPFLSVPASLLPSVVVSA